MSHKPNCAIYKPVPDVCDCGADRLGASLRNRPRMNNKREVTQVTTSMAFGAGCFARTVVVLCADGSLWRLTDTDTGRSSWEQLPAIPGQEED